MAVFTAGCSYLDVEPEKKGTLQEVFEDRTSAENFLYGCYGYLPETHLISGEPQILGAGDELVLTSLWSLTWHWGKNIHIGQFSAADPFYNYWSHHRSERQPNRCAAYDLYGGIRQCYTFLDMIDQVPNASPAEIARWKAEARFLVVYFHYSLLRLYGPICIVEGLIPNDAPEDVYYPKRLPYDDCVKWIADRFDEVAVELEATSGVTGSDAMGRATHVVAKAIKSRMLLYAASPLFNGNSEYYSEFTNNDGEHLISQTADKEKWKTALDAAEEAIDMAKEEGFGLFKSNTGTTDAEKAYATARYMLVNLPAPTGVNTELIWAYSKAAGTEQAMYSTRGLSSNSTTVPYGGISPSLYMVEMYLTENGLPIDKDPAFDYANRYIPEQDGSGEWTVKMHLGREQRFYANIGYDRGRYEADGKNLLLYLRQGETNPLTGLANHNTPGRDDFVPNGYLIKKLMHPATHFASNATSSGIQKYAWPLIRMTELYLNYAEAYVEYYGTLDGKAADYMNELRDRAGIPRIDDAWNGISGKDYREIIRRERNIELMFEGHRYFDARRWKIAHLTFENRGQRWNNYPTVTGVQSYSDYLTLMPSAETVKSFERKHYLFPIDSKNIFNNHNMVQNPGW